MVKDDSASLISTLKDLVRLRQAGDPGPFDEAVDRASSLRNVKLVEVGLMDALLPLLDDYFHLRKENARLQNENESLRKDTVGFQQSLSDPQIIYKLPSEILCIIFRLVLPPSFLLDSSLCTGPKSPWCLSMQTKRELISVCKRWCHVGTPILYEEVTLRRMTQLSSLIQTVELPNVGIGSLIRRVDVKCYVLPDEFSFFDSQLLRLFDKCPNVSRVGYNAVTSPEPLEWTCTFQRQTAISNLFPKLTRLECGENVDFVNLVNALRKCNSLESLTCYLRRPKEPAVQLLPLSSNVDLPHLKALYCVVMRDDDGAYLTSIASRWSMHDLERLFIGGYISNEYTTLKLLQAHGHRLKFLHMPLLLSQGIFPDTQTVLTYCPSLEHLVLPPGSPHPTSHPTITWVDLWSPNNNQQEGYKALRDSLPAAFPSLFGVRQLDVALRSLPDLPSMLHDTTNDGSDFEYDFPGISIIYSFGNLIKKEMDYENYEEDYESSSDESEGSDDIT